MNVLHLPEDGVFVLQILGGGQREEKLGTVVVLDKKKWVKTPLKIS